MLVSITSVLFNIGTMVDIPLKICVVAVAIYIRVPGARSRECSFAHECPFQSFCIEGFCEKVTLPGTTQSILGSTVTRIFMIIVIILIILALIFLVTRWIYGIKDTKERIRSRQASQVSSAPSTLYRVY